MNYLSFYDKRFNTKIDEESYFSDKNQMKQ